ncbi:MAG: diacylglycerol O-acyltransferase / wax synthase, partial [bacterium]
MAHGDRISALDASFLHQEKAGARLHAASVTVFDGPPPTWDELRAHVESRLHLVPRFRQRLAEVPMQQGRPVWVDDPHFNLRYHLRHAGLPAPGSEEQLKNLAGRLFAQPLDRTKPLWELWLVDRLGAGVDGEGVEHAWSGRFALIAKSHHALVDGINAVDITTVLFDTDPAALPPPAPERPWVAKPLPTPAQLLSDALIERATQPQELARSARAALRVPRKLLQTARERLDETGMTSTGSSPAPATPLNVSVGPHRRYTWVDAELSELQGIKDALGGTVNDAVLAVVAGALGRYLRHRGSDTRGLVLKALVPVSVHSDDGDGGKIGSEIAPLSAPLPVGIDDPAAQFRAIRDAVAELEPSLAAIGARELTELAGFASPTLMSQAARLQQSQRSFNLVVTNVPGPQVPLYLLGRRLRALYPVVPITGRQALGIAVMSYDGRLGFGLLADYDALPDVDVLARELRAAIDAL